LIKSVSKDIYNVTKDLYFEYKWSFELSIQRILKKCNPCFHNNIKHYYKISGMISEGSYVRLRLKIEVKAA